MEDRCTLCREKREEDSRYCLYHQRALQNLEEAYEMWKKALNIEWTDFLKTVSEKPETGRWAREVAFNLLNG